MGAEVTSHYNDGIALPFEKGNNAEKFIGASAVAEDKDKIFF
jgi:hypothetical protein